MTHKLFLTIFATLIVANTFAQEWISTLEKGEGMPVFTKTFKAEKHIKKATVHSSALGVYTLLVNGKEIDDEELKPGWTDYRKEIFYQTHTLPSSLLKGDSINITAQVSNGWWIGGITNGTPRECEVSLDFLDQDRTYKMTAFQDGINADLIAMDYKRIEKTVSSRDKYTVKMVMNGGFAAIIE